MRNQRKGSQRHNSQMKCLTLTAEWAEAIFALGKDVENRTWSTRYRGKLLIHAGKTIDQDCTRRLGLDPDRLTRGAILGSVEVIDCVRNSTSRWAMDQRWHWVLRNPRRLSSPVSFRGQQGLYNVRMDNLDDAFPKFCRPLPEVPCAP
jgi:hypothetical protein